MKRFGFCILLMAGLAGSSVSQVGRRVQIESDTINDSKLNYATLYDSIQIYRLGEVNIISFKSDEERNKYFKYKSRILKVLPYVKIAKQLYAELLEKEGNSKKREYKHYKKDVEKEMRSRFENELKNLSTGQGEMLFKLINRETGNSAYKIIKEIKGPLVAWFYQLVGKRYGYDLKDNYNAEEEKMIEYIIKELGTTYNV